MEAVYRSDCGCLRILTGFVFELIMGSLCVCV